MTTPLIPLPDLNYIWEPGKRFSQLRKSKATGEYQDIVALAWHLEIRVVMWYWNVAEGAFERNVTVVDFRQQTNSGPAIRGSMCSTIYILYVNAGASFKEGVRNHYELLYPLADTELKYVCQHSKEGKDNVEVLFQTNRWVCDEDLILKEASHNVAQIGDGIDAVQANVMTSEEGEIALEGETAQAAKERGGQNRDEEF